MKQNKQEQIVIEIPNWIYTNGKEVTIRYQNPDGEYIEGTFYPCDYKDLLSQTRQEAVEEVKQKCKKIYIDEVDWSEWGISDEEAGENFEREYEELSQEKK